jgi:dephospho-CoA kinase
MNTEHYQHETRIGLVGHPSSGKDTVAAHLVDRHKFIHVSTGDLVRFYIAEHDLGEPTRELMHQVGNILRIEHGPDYLVRLALKTQATHLAVSGLRALAEVTALKEAGGIIIGCTAPLELRYRRAKERGRIGDDISFEAFTEQEEAEEVSTNPDAQNVAGVMAMADYTIENSGSLEHLHRQMDTLFSKLTKQAKA